MAAYDGAADNGRCRPDSIAMGSRTHAEWAGAISVLQCPGRVGGASVMLRLRKPLVRKMALG